MNPFLIGVSRSTDHLCRRRIPRVVSETKNLLKIGGDHLDANPIRLAKPFSLERVTQLMRILFALKVEILRKNPISCSGNPSEDGTPLERILFVIERGRPMM